VFIDRNMGVCYDLSFKYISIKLFKPQFPCSPNGRIHQAKSRSPENKLDSYFLRVALNVSKIIKENMSAEMGKTTKMF
jgi:hypothetical protein